MKGIEIGINDIKVNNTFDMTVFAANIIAFSKKLTLSKTEIHALSHFIINGLSQKSKEDLVNNKLLSSKHATANLISSFRKYGIIVKHPFGEKLADDFCFNVSDYEMLKISLILKK